MDQTIGFLVALTGVLAALPGVITGIVTVVLTIRTHGALKSVEKTVNGHVDKLVEEAFERGRLAGVIEERERAAGEGDSGILRTGPVRPDPRSPSKGDVS